MSPPTAVVRRRHIDTYDVDEGHHFLRTAYADHVVRFRKPAAAFNVRSSLLQTGATSFGTLFYLADVQVEVAGGMPHPAIIELRSELRLRTRRTALELRPGDLALLPPQTGFQATWTGYDAIVTTLDSASLQHDAAALLDDEQLAFDFGRPRSKVAALHWSRTASFARATLSALERAGTATPLALRNLTSLVNSSALLCFANSTDDEVRPLATSAPASVRRAVAYIEAHVDEPISLIDIAEAARMSPRGLQASFRRHLDCSPMAHLRRSRLAQARAELLAGAPGTSVLAVAARWGWTNAGRFARAYQQAYGHAPRHDLQS